MNSVIEAVIEFIEKQDWTYSVEPNKPAIHTGVTGKNAHWKCVAVIGRKDEHLLFLSLFPCIVPASKRPLCSELLSRINFRITHGCFEIDFDNGEIRYRTSIPIFNGQVSPEAIEHVVFTNLFVFDYFLPPIMKVLFADQSPTKTLQQKKLSPVRPRFELN